MKRLQSLQAQTAGPVWGSVFGVFVTVAGIGFWWYAEIFPTPSAKSSVATASLLAGRRYDDAYG